MPNQLSNELSSYLKSAQRQPIDWHPWSEGAFQKAKAENRPVLLSIGAVWCHWCHVQAHESWENKEIAGIINKNFVAVKVDRDERPDLDQTYQAFVQMVTGGGGWPLTVFLTPDKKPFFGGTYFPAQTLKSILVQVIQTFYKERGKIDKMVSEVSNILEVNSMVEKSRLEKNSLEKAVAVIINQADMFNGGFGSRPKFPMAEALLFLADYYSKTNRQEVWKFIELTLTKMASGGIYDQLGGGFHRYSVDEAWRVPHFEKLLTDNALLLKVYLKAYQISGKEFFKKIAGEILTFLEREMLGENGLFYSSQDADVKGTKLILDQSGRSVYEEEGGYFTWSKREIMGVLGEKAGKTISMYYGVVDRVETGGKNILRVEAEAEDIADILELKKIEIGKIIEGSKKILFKEREKRERGFTDKNSFTGWNCLAVSAFFDAYKILGETRYLEIGLKNLDFVLGNLYKNTLFHMFSGEATVDGFLDDYVFFIQALVEAHQLTFNEIYLKIASEAAEKMIEDFWDKKDGGFYYTKKKQVDILKTRVIPFELGKNKPILDFSSPAPNSAAVKILLDLYFLTKNDVYKEKAETILKVFSSANPGYELHKATYLSALDYYFNGPKEFFIAGEKEDKTVKEFVKEVHRKTGNKIIYIAGDSKKEAFKGKGKIAGKPTVYMCYKNTCSMPITDLEKLNIV